MYLLTLLNATDLLHPSRFQGFLKWPPIGNHCSGFTILIVSVYHPLTFDCHKKILFAMITKVFHSPILLETGHDFSVTQVWRSVSFCLHPCCTTSVQLGSWSRCPTLCNFSFVPLSSSSQRVGHCLKQNSNSY